MEVQLIKQTNYFVNTQQWIETDEKQIFILDSKIKTKQNKLQFGQNPNEKCNIFSAGKENQDKARIRP